jgi:thiol-disulfide isomerase/thioredoxin
MLRNHGRSRAILSLTLLAAAAPSRAWMPGAPGGTMRIVLDRRAYDARDPGNADFLDCPERPGECSAVLIPRLEADEKIITPRNKARESLRYLTLKGFRARGGDPVGTLALYPGNGGDSVFFDDNNDEDLGNDGPARFWSKGDSCVAIAPRSPAAPFSLCRAGGKAKVWRARCEGMKSTIVLADCDAEPYRLRVKDVAYGIIKGSKDHLIGLADLDDDGKFHLGTGDRLLIDWNGDGMLEKAPDGDGFALPLQEKSFVFSLEDATYQLANSDEGGSWIDLRRLSSYDASAVIFKLVEGNPAPDLRFINMDGDTMSLSDFRGKKVLLNFWSVLCKPCLEQIPSLTQFYTQFGSKNWQVISLTTDKELDLVQQAVMKYHMDWMVGMVGPEAHGYYSNHPLPLNVKIDAKGVVEKREVPLGKRGF